jgi:hypothetical protein
VYSLNDEVGVKLLVEPKDDDCAMVWVTEPVMSTNEIDDVVIWTEPIWIPPPATELMVVLIPVLSTKLIEPVETNISLKNLSTLPKLYTLFVPGSILPLTAIFWKEELAFTIKDPVIEASFINIYILFGYKYWFLRLNISSTSYCIE